MSSIDELHIQGIRCYGPAKDQRVRIPFRTPLTVIFGANGTGKTTIIECLKYITTGDMPPNSKGGAFVHDPNIAREREVKGDIELKFKDVAKRQVTCSRSRQSTQKVVGGVKKIEPKIIDSSILKIGEDGQVNSLHYPRSAEIDTEMCGHLGVSKAVLDNVIFCHQEDSNWPLSEAKMVKTKFDEIFALTRYTMALENIKKFQQEQIQVCNKLKENMQPLQKEVKKAAELRVELLGTQDKVKESQTSISYIDSQLKPTEESLQKLDDMRAEFVEKEKSIAGLKSKKQQIEHNQCQLQEKIGHFVTDSIEEVQKNYKDHKSQLELEKKELQESEALIRRMEIERKELDEQRDRLFEQQGRLRLRAEDNQQSIRDCDTLVRKFSETHDIKAETKGDYSKSNVEEFLASLIQKRKSKEQDARSEMEDFNNKMDDIQDKLDHLNLEQAKYNQSKEIKTKQIKENEEKKSKIENELRCIAGLDTTTVERAERKLQEAEGNLKEFQNTDICSLETEYESLQRQKRTIDGQVSQLQEELDKLSKQATQRGVLETLRKKKEEAEMKISSIMAEVERDLKVIFDVMPTSEDLPSKLSAEKASQERRVGVVEDKLRKARENKATLSCKKESLNDDLERQNKRKQDLQQKIDQVCGGKEYQSLVEDVQRDIESTQDDIAETEGSAPFFKKCVKKLRTSKKCPVCTRGFDSQSDVDKVIMTLISMMNESVPRTISDLKDRLREQQQKHKSLQQLKSSIEELEKLTSREIPVKINELSSTNRELQAVENDLKKLEMECSACKERLQQICAAEPKVSQLSYCDKDLKKLEQQIAVEEAKLGDIGTAGRSHIVVRREHQNALQELEEVERKRECKSREIAETKQHLLDLVTFVQNLRGEKLEITESMRRREGLMEQKAGLVSANESLEKEVTDMVSKTTKLQDNLTAMKTKKESTLKEKGEAEGLCKAKVNDILKDERELDALIRVINSYYSSGDKESLERCEDEIDICQRKSNEQAKKRNDLQKKINELREQLATAKMRLRKFEDTIQFLNQQKEIGNVAGRIRQLETELRELGVDDYDGEYNRLKNKADQLREQRAHQEGKRMVSENEMRRMQQDLDSDPYKDADTRYLERAANIKAIEVTIADLDKFYKALDRAITQYHMLKMDEVNKIIKEYWIKIYQGGDIDNIEIESSYVADGSSSTAKRRVYNYKVVMDKGGVKLDMRGRCSAGQKVLASIVIRLALAEAFCLNCGVLTLDEPTTNLDSKNLKALAQALADIITARRERSNFQLVVITHDQGFVNMMGRSDHADDYLLLEREGESTKVQVCKFNPSFQSA